MESTLTHNPAATGALVAAPDDGALQLPFDHAPTPATPHQLTCHGFELVLPDVPNVPAQVLLVSVFGIALARYNAQVSIPFAVSRLLATGQTLSTSALRLHTGPQVTLTHLLGEVTRQMAGVVDRPGVAWGNGGAKAAMSFVESELGTTPDALALLAQASPALRSTDLQCVVMTAPGPTWQCAFVYNAHVFKASSVARFAGHLGVLLAHAAARLDLPIADLPMLSADERVWLQAANTGRTRDLPTEFLHQTFEANCRAAPHAVALHHRDQQLSYAELNERANQLAHHLIAQGISTEDPVVVCLEPGFDIAVALLGIWKAGAVYVPLDPGYPPARIRAILDDTRPKRILARSPLVARLGLDPGACFAFDSNGAALDGMPTHNPGLPVDPTQTASIYYTSGTTGQPKGVMASQANLRAYIDLARQRYAIDARDVMPAIARFSFSISMFELMAPLASGGTLVVLDRDHVLDLDRLANTLSEVTFFHAGPSLLKNVLSHIRQQPEDVKRFAGVRHASSGGDMIAPEVLESLKEIFPNAEVFVIYGCSEISCMGCTYPVPRDQRVTRTFVGRPFDNMVVKLFDAALNPVPVGIVGEIFFAGAGVVKGYLNRPELTVEKFIQIGAQRFYRTGDMGRLSEDGWLEILGRNDFQINVRGMRIEIGEVEYTLRKAPGVRDAVVMAKATASGEKVLVAYVVPDAAARAGASGGAERAAAVRRHMAEHLPDYMVPSTYVELENLPLNHNMKVDRRALPEPVFAQQRLAGDADLRWPETQTERDLARAWMDILAVEHVALDDNLFGLGGQSLQAMQFVARVRQEQRVELEGMEVLRETLEVLAALCDQRQGREPVRSRSRGAARVCGATTEIFHFGHAQSLYGVVHRPARPKTDEAVLICAPIGLEQVRIHFVLNQLARQLANAGVPVLRFDFFGCADSLGETVDASFSRWFRDVADARLELAHRTGAMRITAVGVRLGATVLCKALRSTELSRLVLWDPVLSGAKYVGEQQAMQSEHFRNTRHMRLWSTPPQLVGSVEMMGTMYSDKALQELRSLAIDQTDLPQTLPTALLVSSRTQGSAEPTPHWLAAQARDGCEKLQLDCGWTDLAQRHEVLPDVGISRALARMVKETR